MPGMCSDSGLSDTDLFRVRWLGDPRLSRDGRHLAYVVAGLDAAADITVAEIVVVDLVTGEEHHIARRSSVHISPLVAACGPARIHIRCQWHPARVALGASPVEQPAKSASARPLLSTSTGRRTELP